MVKILVVEDEYIVAMDLQNRLTSLDYDVPGIASSGKEAIEKASLMQPDLILMDISLGGEMDGIEAGAKIKELYNIPVIYITAYADARTLQRAKVTEPFGYILKPFEEREILTNIEMALYKHRMDSQVRESERWLSNTLKSIGAGVIATSDRGVIKFTNHVAEMLTGWAREDALNHDLKDVFVTADEDPVKPQNPFSWPSTGMLLSRDGRKIPILVCSSPIKDEEDRTVGVVIIFNDITERKRFEEVLTRKTRIMTDYTAIISSINRADSLEGMMNDFLNGLLELLQADAGAVYLYGQDDPRSLQFAVAAARTDAGMAVQHRQVLHDLQANPGTISTAVTGIFDEDAGEGVVVPIMVDALIGIIMLYSAGKMEIDKDIQAMLVSAGVQIGIAIENRQLKTLSESRSEERPTIEKPEYRNCMKPDDLNEGA
ncbi:MAG TPA: response regulator [Methanocella sp.]|nr:response regulator [Methanocella sp.]